MSSTALKLAYLTAAGSSDARLGPGASYYASQAFASSGVGLDFIGPLFDNSALVLSLRRFFCQTFQGKRHLIEREPLVLQNYAQQAAQKVALSQADAIFSVGAMPLAYLETDKPLVFWSDHTLAGLISMVPGYQTLCEASLEFGHEAERRVLERCSLAIYASEWAAQSAIQTYGVDARKVKVVPYGPNLVIEKKPQEVENLIETRPKSTCRLLFVGTDWKTKGGPLAVAITEELIRSGVKAELTVVGCTPEIPGGVPGFVRPVGFLSKTRREARATLERLYGESHFLLMPSTCERSAVTCVEANAFGLPAVAIRVGGASSVVRDDVNGKLFLPDAAATQYALYLSGLFNRFDQYRALAKSSFAEYESQLNWAVATQRVRELVCEMLAARTQAADPIRPLTADGEPSGGPLAPAMTSSDDAPGRVI